MQFWGGKLVFHGETDASPVASGATTPIGRSSPAPGARPSGLLLPPLLRDVELAPAQVTYVTQVLHPLLSAMLQELVATMPEPDRAAPFCLMWLLVHLKVPKSLTDPIGSWLGYPGPAKPATATPAGAPAARVSIKVGAEVADKGAARKEARQEEEEDEEDEEGSSAVVDMRRPSTASSATTDGGAAARGGATRGTQAARAVAEWAAAGPPRSSLRHPSSSSTAGAHAHRTASILKRPSAASSGSGPQDAPMTRQVSIVVDRDPGKRDSVQLGKLRAKRRAASSARPPPEVPLDEVAELIRGVPLLKHLEEEETKALARCAKVCCFDADRDVVRQGARHEALHIIVSGEGRVSVLQVVGTLQKGDSFGEHAVVKRHLSSSSTISAQGDEHGRLVTLAITYEDISRLKLMSRVKEARAALGNNVVARTGDTPEQRGQRRAPSPKKGAGQKPIGVHVQRPEDRQLVLHAIRCNTHFSDWLQLSEKQVEMMADMMRLVTVETGEDVVRKDEIGNKFYIVNDGILEVVGGDTQTEMDIKVRLRSGDSFGELALLYNCPRKATVRAQRQCQLWYLDRDQFREVMKLKSDTRIVEYVKLVNTVALLAERLSDSQKEVLADALEEVFFVQGEQVVTQSEVGDTFYMIFEGGCEVRVNGEPRSFLQKGNYFGERALLTKEPRAATVVVTTETATLLALDSASFHLLLGHALGPPPGGPAGGAVAVAPAAATEAAVAAEGAAGFPGRRGARRSITSELLQRMTADTSKPKDKVPRENLELIGALGFGSYGSVTLQRDRRTGKLYALKALSKGYIKRENMEQHVMNERKAMEMLDSKFLVHMHCSYRDNQYVYFLLDPALGGELYDVYIMNEDFFGSEIHAKFYLVCATLGIEHLHARRIIYRDLKMENVLLYSNGYACLTDLGLAKVVIGKTYTVCGTADYFAPETLRQVGHNRAVDWWALGVMLFIMMAGRSPFDAEDVMQIYRNIVKGFKKETFPPDFSQDLTDLIQGLCRKKPEERIPMGPGGIGNIQAHVWLAKYPWDMVAKRTMRAPYQPPEPNFQALKAALEGGMPKSVEFVENDPTTDNGWDADF